MVIKYNNNVLFTGFYVWKITYGYIYVFHYTQWMVKS